MSMKKYMPLTEQVRKAIEISGKTRYRIAKETGISEVTLCRFASGKRGLSMEALDKIGENLGLEITFSRKPRKKKGK
jgi:transcriptional regulator with XRE-family HTH domain